MRGPEAVEARRRDPDIRQALAELGGWLPLMVFFWATRRERARLRAGGRIDWRNLPSDVPQPGTVPDSEVQAALLRHGYTITRQGVAIARRRHGWPTYQPQHKRAHEAEGSEG